MATIVCTFTDITGQSTQGVAEKVALSSHERMLRSSKRAGIFFGIALVSVLVPMLHFVLVPAFLLASIFFFVKTMKESELISKAESQCPQCHKQAVFTGPINPHGSKEICPNCRQLLRLTFAT